MKKLQYIILAVSVAFLSASCVKEDHAEGLRVTYHPSFEIKGGSTVAHQVGSAWKDPGCTALLNGEDVTAQIVIDDTVDPNKSGIYSISYSFTNPDGFSKSVSRTVVVYDIANAGTADISGTYNTHTVIYEADGVTVQSDWAPANSPMKITKGPATGLFYMQDLFGGRYSVYAGYGAAYESKALILLNADNKVSLLSCKDPWGAGIIPHDASKCVYDPATGSVTIDYNWLSWDDTSVFVCEYSK